MCKGSRNSTEQQTAAVHKPAAEEPQGRIQGRRVLDLQVGSLLAPLEMKVIPLEVGGNFPGSHHSWIPTLS